MMDGGTQPLLYKRRDNTSAWSVVLSLCLNAALLSLFIVLNFPVPKLSDGAMEIAIAIEQPPLPPPPAPSQVDENPQPAPPPVPPTVKRQPVRTPSLPSAPAVAAQPVSPSVATVAVEPPSPPAPTASLPPTVTGDQRQEINRYTLQVWEQIQQHRPHHVPVPGTAVVEFRLSDSGSLVAAEIKHSSGNIRLDRTALDTVQDAAPFPPPPAGATPQDLTFSIPFEFR